MKLANNKNKRLEFYQKIVLISWVAALVWISTSYVLSYLSRDVNQAVTLAIITEVLGVTISYAIYQGKLKTSLNKHGLTMGEGGQTHRVKNILNSEHESEL